MRKVGEYVTYKENGICRITKSTREYYVLEPVYGNNMTLYVPKKSTELIEQMSDVLTKREVNALIKKVETTKRSWINDSKKRNDRFTEMLKSGSKEEILWLYKVLSIHKEKVEKSKKSFYATDKRILDNAERIITEEFAYVLGIEPCDVKAYIIKKIKDK